MEFLKNIDKETIIICNHSMKRKILQYQSEQDEILPIHFFTLDEFMKKYFFDLSFEAYLYVMNTYHVKYDVASMYLKNLYYVEDKVYHREKLDFLVKLKKELFEHDLLSVDDGFANYLKNKNIIIYGFHYLDAFYQHIFDELSSVCDVTYIEKKYGFFLPSVYHFTTMEEEVIYVANSICKLLKNIHLKLYLFSFCI